MGRQGRDARSAHCHYRANFALSKHRFLNGAHRLTVELRFFMYTAEDINGTAARASVRCSGMRRIRFVVPAGNLRHAAVQVATGPPPRCLVVTTPRPTKLIRELLAREGRGV